MATLKVKTIGASKLATLRRCPRGFYYSHILGLEPDSDTPPLRMGSVWHGCQEAKNNEATLVEILKYVCAYYEALGKPQDVTDYDWEIERETVKTLFAGYWDYYKDDDDLTVEEAETSFDIPVENPATSGVSRTFTNTGRIDAIGGYKDEQVIVEYKLTGSAIDDERFWMRLRADGQITQYVIGARALGHDVGSVLYIVTRKPTIHPKQIPMLDDKDFKIVLDADGQRVYKKNGEPRQSGDKAKGWKLQTEIEPVNVYRARLAKDILARPEFYYQRRIVPRLDDEIEEYKDELWQQSQMLKEAIRNNRWFRNVHIFNCPHCDFENVCLSGGRITEDDAAPTGFRFKG